MFCHVNWWKCQIRSEKPDNDAWMLSKLVLANKSSRRETKRSVIDLFASELKHFANWKPDPKWSYWNSTGLISWHLLAFVSILLSNTVRSGHWHRLEIGKVQLFSWLKDVSQFKEREAAAVLSQKLSKYISLVSVRLTDCKCAFQGGTLKVCWSPTSMSTKLLWTASESQTNTPSLLQRPMMAPLKSGTVRRWRERPQPPGESRPETRDQRPDVQDHITETTSQTCVLSVIYLSECFDTNTSVTYLCSQTVTSTIDEWWDHQRTSNQRTW